jgi:hypothetical protein
LLIFVDLKIGLIIIAACAKRLTHMIFTPVSRIVFYSNFITPKLSQPLNSKPMKQIKLIKISLACLALAVLCGVAQAQPVNLLGNPGFEIPALGKYTNFDAGGPTPFWNDDGVNYTNTGIENAGAHSGTYRAFEMVGDGGAYQISTSPVPLNTGDQIILSWWALGDTSSDSQGTNLTDPMAIVGIITATNYNSYLLGGGNDLFTNTTAVLVVSNGLPPGWAQYSVTYSVQSADVGKYPGVFFNTGEVGTNTAGVWADYDDFALYVLPAGSKPLILNPPASQTSPLGANLSFIVSAVNATGYQWQGGAPGSGVYTNLLNAGQFGGVNTPNLTISGVTTNNNMDIIVVVSNGSGSVTSAPPANLTVAAIIYFESFGVPTTGDQPINNVGWRNDISGNNNRLFTGNSGLTWPRCAVYSYNVAGGIEAFWATTLTANGGPFENGMVTNKMAFPGINLATVYNLNFSLAMNANGAGTYQCFFAVQLNNNNWYVSTNQLPEATASAFITNSMKFNPAATAWNQLTVSPNGSYYAKWNTTNPYPQIGTNATADLTGFITGVGVVYIHITSGDGQFDNFTVSGAIPPTALPVISAPPFSQTNFTGTTATFTVAATTNGSTAGLTYQWQTNTAVGSGTWATLSDGGQFSGSGTATLSVANVTTAANHKDYRVIVTDGAGSTTSTPPATLTIVDSAPIVLASTVIYPDAQTAFATTAVTNEAGNNNTVNFTASFAGAQPISYQWKVSPNPNGSGAVIIPGATSPTYTLSNPQVGDTGYYSLQASNHLSGATPTNSGWVQLVILPASSAAIQWSAPVAITNLTAAQILGLPGLFVGASSYGAGSVVTVTIGAETFTFNTGSWYPLGGGFGGGKTAVYTGPSTGDTNLDTVLGIDEEDAYTGTPATVPPTVTLNYLTVGQLYSVQLFAINDTAGSLREISFANDTDPADVSPAFQMGDNVYVLGTFIATSGTQVIDQNEADGHGYMSCVVVRNLAPSPTITQSGSNLKVAWPSGTLLQTTNIITGPWITNHSTSPLTVVPTAPTMFYRTQIP